jgi:hypothetical protein
MTAMQTGTAILAFLAIVGCSDAKSQRPNSPAEALEENSCAISCLTNTNNKYAGLGGSVGCSDTFSPLCQCTGASRPLAERADQEVAHFAPTASGRAPAVGLLECGHVGNAPLPTFNNFRKWSHR